jgi:hypothetical protein
VSRARCSASLALLRRTGTQPPAQHVDPGSAVHHAEDGALHSIRGTHQTLYAALALTAFTSGTLRKPIAIRFQALMVAISMVRLTVSASEK